jgi:hypothetical protein
MRESGRVLGIDIGYSDRKKTTGVCLLSWTSSAIEVLFEKITTDPEVSTL